MTLRAKRLLRIGFVFGVIVVYWQTATWIEERAINAQRPVPAGGTGPRCVDRDRLMADVRLLASPQMDGRRTGTPGGLKARAWIASEFKAIGLEPAGHGGYLQPFTFTHFSIRRLLLPGPARTEYKDPANVLGRIDGSLAGAKPIIISAHYDHLGTNGTAIFHGADDNASGVATLLAVARSLRTQPFRHPTIFAAFDAEELGLEGSDAFVHAPESRCCSATIGRSIAVPGRRLDVDVRSRRLSRRRCGVRVRRRRRSPRLPHTDRHR